MSKWSKRKAHRLNTVMANENPNSRCDGALLNMTCRDGGKEALRACAAPGVSAKLVAHAERKIMAHAEKCAHKRVRLRR